MRGAVTAVKKLNRSRICEANVAASATVTPSVEMAPLATIAATEARGGNNEQRNARRR